MTLLPRLVLIAAAALAAGPLAAATKTAYRCTDEHGAIAFQDKPCRGDQKSQSFEYEPAPPPPPAEAQEPVPEEPTAAMPPPPEPSSLPAPPPPRPPAPTLFRCVRADNDKVYYSETGDTPPYRVPAGILGLPGSRPGTPEHMSAPEANRPPVSEPGGADALAATYVEVRDRCERLSPAEACRALRAQLDDNLSRQRNVGQAERTGLSSEARVLADKLAGC